MDQFNVPQYINRIVYNSVADLQSLQPGFVPTVLICRAVKSQLQLQKHKKINDLNKVISQSLCNMTDLGVLLRAGSSQYGIRHNPNYTKSKSRLNMVASKSKSKIAKSKQRLRNKRNSKSTLAAKRSSQLMCKECCSTCSNLILKYKSIKLKKPKKVNKTNSSNAST